MDIDENYIGKRVRIIGKPGDTTGYNIEVRDAATNEPINNVYRAVIMLDAKYQNAVELSYYQGKDGRIVAGADGEPVTKKVTIQNPEVDVTAFEVSNGRSTD
jgi:hypothetical protein